MITKWRVGNFRSIRTPNWIPPPSRETWQARDVPIAQEALGCDSLLPDSLLWKYNGRRPKGSEQGPTHLRHQ